MLDRFEAKVERITESGCWVWTGALSGSGYGRVNVEGKNRQAHRTVYAMHKGAIPEGMQIDHLCKVRCCVNPDHLEPVTQLENLRRADHFAKGKFKRAVTHCPHGHPYDGENLRVVTRSDGRVRRFCVTCNKAYCAANYLKRKGRAN